MTTINSREDIKITIGENATVNDMGRAVAAHCKWDGVAILETAMAALEDANFHTEALMLQDVLNKLNDNL